MVQTLALFAKWIPASKRDANGKGRAAMIANGATTIGECWDSYTKEDALGRHKAAMNSFSHDAFGAVCQRMFQTQAGIQSKGFGFKTNRFDPFAT